MKLSRILSCVSLLSALCAISCTKKEVPEASNSPKQVLMASQWKKSDYKENGVVTPFYASCEMDDILIFSSDGNYTLSEGAIACSTSGAQTDFYVIDQDNKTMRWGLYGSGEISFNSTNTSFTFKRTGAATIEYIFVKK